MIMQSPFVLTDVLRRLAAEGFSIRNPRRVIIALARELVKNPC